MRDRLSRHIEAELITEQVGKNAVLIKKIAKLTDENDHNGSILMLAKAIGEKGMSDIMQHLIAIHKIEGSMPSELIQYRNTLLKQLLDTAKSHFSVAEYEQLQGSF